MTWTYDDFLKLPNDGNRYEILDGELYINGFPDTKAQRVFRNLYVALDEYTNGTELGYVSVMPTATYAEPGGLFVFARAGDPPDLAIAIGEATPIGQNV